MHHIEGETYLVSANYQPSTFPNLEHEASQVEGRPRTRCSFCKASSLKLHRRAPNASFANGDLP